MSEETSQQVVDYRRVEQTIAFLENHYREQPSLEEMAASVHLSKYHFQRLFKRWAGVSPTQFLQFLTLSYAKTQLAASQSVYEASLAAGLSGAGRLHDLFITLEAMTPGQYKQRGAGLDISYGLHTSPFGQILLATTNRGICALRFIGDDGIHRTLAQITSEWPEANYIEDPTATAPIANRLFKPAGNGNRQPFHLSLKGTNFQVQVWRALLAIPPGTLVSYQDVANYIGNPTASRAVAGAIAHNPIGYLIPCHRVINKTGRFHQYRWGSTRKKAIIGWEAARYATAYPAS